MGPNTREALRNWQRAQGLDVDGLSQPREPRPAVQGSGAAERAQGGRAAARRRGRGQRLLVGDRRQGHRGRVPRLSRSAIRKACTPAKRARRCSSRRPNAPVDRRTQERRQWEQARRPTRRRLIATTSPPIRKAPGATRRRPGWTPVESSGRGQARAEPPGADRGGAGAERSGPGIDRAAAALARLRAGADRRPVRQAHARRDPQLPGEPRHASRPAIWTGRQSSASCRRRTRATAGRADHRGHRRRARS